jgi:hypothetical protein
MVKICVRDCGGRRTSNTRCNERHAQKVEQEKAYNANNPVIPDERKDHYRKKRHIYDYEQQEDSVLSLLNSPYRRNQ